MPARNVDLLPSDANFVLKTELSPALNVLERLISIFGPSAPTRAREYLTASRLAWAKERTGDSTLQDPGVYSVGLVQVAVDGTIVPLTGGSVAGHDSNASVTAITAIGIAVGVVAACVLIAVFIMVKTQGLGLWGSRDTAQEAEDARRRQKALDIKPVHVSPPSHPLTAASSTPARPAAPLRTGGSFADRAPEGPAAQHTGIDSTVHSNASAASSAPSSAPPSAPGTARSPAKGRDVSPAPTAGSQGSYTEYKEHKAPLSPKGGGYSRGIMTAQPQGSAKVAPLPLPGHAQGVSSPTRAVRGFAWSKSSEEAGVGANRRREEAGVGSAERYGSGGIRSIQEEAGVGSAERYGSGGIRSNHGAGASGGRRSA